MRTLVKHILLLVNAMLHRDTSPKVVFYHDIGQTYTSMGTPVNLFEAHMSYLKGLNIHSATTTSNYNYHEVAFDDGFHGIWDHRELLRKYDIHPIVFIAVALVGQPGYLAWDEIRTLQNDYGVNFQCHTWSHQTLIGPVNTDLPIPSDPNFRTDAWYHHEVVDSKNELEKQLGKQVDFLCFPVGYFSDDVIKRCAATGYTNLYASFPGNKDDANSILHLQSTPTPTRLIPRCLCQSLSLADFKLVLAGGMNPMRKRYLKMHYVETAK